MASKICKAIATTNNGATVFSTEDGREIPTPIVIRPDDAGVLWYWHLTPEDIDAERVTADAAAKAYRAANA